MDIIDLHCLRYSCNRWTTISQSRVGSRDGTVHVDDDAIYVIGHSHHYDYGNAHQDYAVQRFTFATAQWEIMHSCSSDRYRTNRWCEKQQCPTSISQHIAIHISRVGHTRNPGIYVLTRTRGFVHWESQKHNQQLCFFDTVESKWEQLPSPSGGHVRLDRGLHCDGKLYFWPLLNDHWYTFDIATHTWKTIVKNPVAKNAAGHCMVAIRDLVVVLGPSYVGNKLHNAWTLVDDARWSPLDWNLPEILTARADYVDWERVETFYLEAVDTLYVKTTNAYHQLEVWCRSPAWSNERWVQYAGFG